MHVVSIVYVYNLNAIIIHIWPKNTLIIQIIIIKIMFVHVRGLCAVILLR